MNGIIKWGIIGLGNIAHEFAKSYFNEETCEIAMHNYSGIFS